jgi:cytochrome P450
MRARLPPGLRRPALAQLYAYITRPYAHFDEQRQRFGDVFTIRLPGIGEQVVVGAPDALKELLTGSYDAYARDAAGLGFLLGGSALIFQHDQRHRELRNLMTPPFQGERMRAYGPVMARVTDEVLAARTPGLAAPIQREMQEITVRVILHCVFGMEDEARLARLKQLFTDFFDNMLTPAAFLAAQLLSGERLLRGLEWLGAAQRATPPAAERPLSRLPLKRQADRLGAIDALLFEEIERAQDEARGRHPTTPERQDILAMLVRARDQRGVSLTRAELRDQLMMLLLGGHETTANSLCWALYELARRPDVVAEIRSEQRRVFGDVFDARRVRELPYLGAVIQESMRLSPIAVGMARRLKQPLRVSGHELAPGTVVIPSFYLAQRHPSLWERPNEFDPTRFLNKKAAAIAHFPFGAGVWRCLGAAFADYEMRVVLSRLLQRYDVVLAPSERALPLLKGVTITPRTGLSLRLYPLRQAERLDAAGRAGERAAPPARDEQRAIDDADATGARGA